MRSLNQWHAEVQWYLGPNCWKRSFIYFCFYLLYFLLFTFLINIENVDTICLSQTQTFLFGFYCTGHTINYCCFSLVSFLLSFWCNILIRFQCTPCFPSNKMFFQKGKNQKDFIKLINTAIKTSKQMYNLPRPHEGQQWPCRMIGLSQSALSHCRDAHTTLPLTQVQVEQGWGEKSSPSLYTLFLYKQSKKNNNVWLKLRAK